jgi:hypothetical protein
VTGNQPAMRGQEGVRPHWESVPAAPRQHPTHCREQQPVVRLEPRLAHLAAENRQLVPQDEDLQLLVRSPRAISRINSSNRHTRMYSHDTSKGGLQQTGQPTLPRRLRSLDASPVEFLHPTRILSGNPALIDPSSGS